MKFNSQSPVGELADQLPRAARVFEILGIDYCCNDERSLQAAATAAGYDVAEVVDILSRSKLPAEQVARADWSKVPFAELTSHIVQMHHRRARRMLVDLLELLGRVASAHAATHPQLWKIKDALEDIARQLIPHMLKEEQYLFPYMATMDQKMLDDSMLVPLFGTVQYPLQTIRHDHNEDLAFLAAIRERSNNFTPPDKACGRFRILYAMLSEFADALKGHIHLENDILFPRAIEVERNAARSV